MLPTALGLRTPQARLLPKALCTNTLLIYPSVVWGGGGSLVSGDTDEASFKAHGALFYYMPTKAQLLARCVPGKVGGFSRGYFLHSYSSWVNIYTLPLLLHKAVSVGAMAHGSIGSCFQFSPKEWGTSCRWERGRPSGHRLGRCSHARESHA